MRFSEFIRGAVLIFMASSFVRPLMADPRTNVAAVACGSVQAVSPATFATNAVLAMNNEISLVYQNGFGTTSVGEAPNTLFGLAQCYRDLSSTDCKLCYNDLQSIIATCFPKTGGRVFLDGCFARYENFSFFNQGIDSVFFKNCSSSKNHSQLHKLNRVLKKVIGTVSLASRRIKGFAVASDSISSLTVYALSQCWESLDEKTCTSCLQAAASSIMSCSPSVEGRSLNAGCYMRYSTELFWNLNQTTTTHLPGTHKRLLIILGSALVGFLALTVIGFWKAKGYLGRAYRKSLKDSHGSGLSTSTYLSKLNFRYKELERATNNFDSSNKLGQGSYGSVYKVGQN